MKRIGALLALVLCIGLFAACGGKKVADADETTIILNEDGSLTQVAVEDFDEGRYDADDLKSYVEDAVSEYAAKHGEESVTLDSVKVEDGIAKMVLTFRDAKTYADFEGVDFFVGTVSEAMIAGYRFNDFFSSVTDGVKNSEDSRGDTESGDATHNVLGKVVIVGENTAVKVNGKIVYVSAMGSNVKANDTVSMNVDSAYGNVAYIIYE